MAAPGLPPAFAAFVDDPHGAGVFTDFDGTLSPIVDDPAAAHPVEGALDVLDELASSLRLGQAEPGVVYLVGAGPGDPGLVTVRAARLVATADVVLDLLAFLDGAERDRVPQRLLDLERAIGAL